PTLPSRMHPMVNDLATPLLTLGGTFSQQTNTNNYRLKALLSTFLDPECKDCWTTVNLYDAPESPDKNSFSMNWVISDTTLKRMDQRILQNDSLNYLVRKIGR
ncbi:MAG TPA: hypothetical protein VEC12_04400, partial [Bacteroidia bacterium]|nr:hypothetical protein [Bacteroidia bacterium]